MTDELVSSGEAQRQMEAVSRVAQLSSASIEVDSTEGGDDNTDPLLEEREIEELEAGL
jgi:hypothetical protein